MYNEISNYVCNEQLKPGSMDHSGLKPLLILPKIGKSTGRHATVLRKRQMFCHLVCYERFRMVSHIHKVYNIKNEIQTSGRNFVVSRA